MEVPMLDENEYSIAYKLYGDGFKNKGDDLSRLDRFKSLLDFYKEVTGWDATEPNAIMHHRVAQYGPPCEKCGKPYRTNEASFCAACGNKRI